MKYTAHVSELIGRTPIVRINSFPLPVDVHLFAKLEYFNPGGSIKDRLGKFVIQRAIKEGKLKRGGTIIEPTAGNTGIGLALAAILYDIKAIFVTPEKCSQEKQNLMRALGATVIQTPTALGMEGAIAKTKVLLAEMPSAYYPGQFQNTANPDTYYNSLGPEIDEALDGKIDIFVAGAGTGGTFTGTSRYLKEKHPQIKTVIVEPEGSILQGDLSKPHRIEGIGMEFKPSFLDESYFDTIHTISDEAAFKRVAEVAKKEGLLVGSSSGAALEASLIEAAQASPGTNIVTIFPDSSERYLSNNMYS